MELTIGKVMANEVVPRGLIGKIPNETLYALIRLLHEGIITNRKLREWLDEWKNNESPLHNIVMFSELMLLCGAKDSEVLTAIKNAT